MSDELSLLELSKVLSVEISVLRGAEFGEATLQDLSSDFTLWEVKASDEISIVFIYSCQFNSYSTMKEHLLNESFAFIIDLLFSVPWSIKVNELYFDLSFQSHAIGCYKRGTEHVFKDGSKRPGLLLGLLKDFACAVVSLTGVNNLASVPVSDCLVSIPNSLALL